MNKLIRKIAGLVLGFALVTGVGVLVSKSFESKSVNASEAPAYILDGTKAGSGSQYAGENTTTQSGVSWKINGNISQTPWRVGGNKNNGLNNAGTIRMIQSQSVVSSEDITKVVVNTTKPSSNGITPTNVSLKVGTAVGGSTISSLSKGSWSSSVTFDRPSGLDWSNKYFEIDFTMPANTTTTNKFIEINSIEFYYEAAVERGEVSIDAFSTNVLFNGESGQFTYTWNPLSSGATVKSVSWTSNNTDALTINSSGNYSVVGAGLVKLTLNVTDSNDQTYEAVSSTLYTSNDYSFELDDKVAIVAPTVSMELTSFFVDGSNKYGVGSIYSGTPNGTYAFTVENGDSNCPGSLSFVKDGSYLAWTSGNTIIVSNTKNENSSWYVSYSSDGCLMTNAAGPTHQLWWNNTSTALRFACYENKTHGNSYRLVDLVVVDEIPVRGTLEISSPLVEMMKQNTSGSLTYNWTPADGTSTQIVSHTWTSNKSDVISINGDTYTAVAPGKARITLNATDGIGQEYTVMTSEITVVGVVSGAYEKVTSVKNGDVVTIVCETAESQLLEIKSGDGHFVYYDTAPASVYDLTLVANGSYFAFETSDNKYLSWNTSTKLALVEPSEATDNSYWSISFDENDNAIIQNKAEDNGGYRRIEWSESSSKFACYKQNETLIQLFAPVISYSQAVVAFAESFLDLECDATGANMPDTYEWLAYKGDFESDALTATDREDLRKAVAFDYSFPSTDVEKVQAAMAKYDYVIVKYNKGRGLSEQFPDFINRNPSANKVIASPIIGINSDDSGLMLVVITFTAISFVSIGALLIIKRKRHY